MFERIIGSTIGAIAGAIAGKIENVQLSRDQERLYTEAQINAIREQFQYPSSYQSSSISLTSSSRSRWELERNPRYRQPPQTPIQKPKPPPPPEFFKREEFDVE
jgi:hypothetical protein